MATLVLSAVGRMVGGPIGGSIGAIIGQQIDQRLFAPKAREGPRLGDLSVQTSSYGSAIPKIFGTMRVAGTVIWSTDLIERRATTGSKGGPRTVEYSYSASFAVALSERPVREVRRIWADGKLLRGAAGDWKAKTKFRLYPGDEEQAPDPLIAAAEGAGQAPAFRGVAYAMFEELELADFGNRIPSLTFEVIADEAPVSIGSIAETLSGRVLTAGESTMLTGFAAIGESVRGAIEDLAELVPLSIIDDGGDLLLTVPGEPADAIGRSQETGRREVVRRAASGLPREVSVTYYDAARDYQTGLQRASGGPGAEARGEQRALPAVLDAGAAKAVAERRLDALWAGRVGATVTLGWARAELRPGRLVRLEREGGLWRVERVTIGAMTARLDLVRVAGEAMVPSVAASPGRVLEQTDLAHGPTVLRIYDVPSADGLAERPVVAVLAAGTEPGWRRALLSASFDGGASWQDIGMTAAPAVLGLTMTALPPGDAALFDDAGCVEVELLNDGMELLSRDDDALVAGANLALIGQELVQFGRAEQVGPRRHRLSRLLRGRRGTEWAMAGHLTGTDFALIESESARSIDLPAGTAVGAEVRLLASGIADEEPVEALLLLSGEALRPPAPVHVRAAAVGDDWLLNWVRRSRIGWSWTSGADAPFGEEREAYRLTFNGGRSVEVEAPSYLYSALDRAGDGAGPVIVEITQAGTHAVSRPAAIIIP